MNITVSLWWVEPGCMPDAHQSHSIPSCLSLTRERKLKKKRFTGWDKGKERSFTDYCHRRKWLYVGKPVYYQLNQSRVMRNENWILKRILTIPPFFLGLTFFPNFSTSSAWVAQGEEEWRLRSICHMSSLPFLSPQEECRVPRTGDSSPQVLLMGM